MSRKKGIISAIATFAQIVVLAIAIALSHGGAGAKAAGSITVSGTVSYNNTGEPNVSVYAVNTNSGTEYGPTTTNSDGQYTLDVDPGTYNFHFNPASGSGLNSVVDSNVTVLDNYTLDVELVPISYTLSGTVLDADGDSIQGAIVTYESTTNGTPVYGSATTGSNGHYSTLVTPGQYTLTNVRDPDGFSYDTSSSSGMVDLTGGDATAPDIHLPPFTTVTTTVKDSSGNLLNGAQVEYSLGSNLGSTFGSFQITVGTTTVSAPTSYYAPDTGGFYHFEYTGSEGTTKLSVPVGTIFSQGDGQTDSMGDNICASDDAVSAGIACLPAPLTVNGPTEVSLTVPLSYTLSGTVLDADGHPMQGAIVTYESTTNGTPAYGTATTDSNGQYSTLVTPGQYMLTNLRDPKGFQFDTSASGITVDLTNGDATAPDIHLPPFTTITAIVKDSSGNPLNGAQVTFALGSNDGDITGNSQITIGTTPVSAPTSYYDPETEGFYHFGYTDSDGTSTLSVPIGTTISQSEGQSATFADNICASDGAISTGVGCLSAPLTVSGPSEVSLIIPISYTLSGTVLDADGDSMQGAIVTYESTTNGTPAYGTATTDSNGQYAALATPGQYTLISLRDPSGFSYDTSSSTTTIDLTNGDATAPDIHLPPFTTVTTTVKDSSGNPLNGAQVEYTLGSTNGSTFGNFQITIGTTPVSAPTSYYDPETESWYHFGYTDSNGVTTLGVPVGTIFSQAYGQATTIADNICASDNTISAATACLPAPLTVNSPAEVLFQIEPQPILSTPTNLTAPTPTQNPALSWDATSGATSYNIYRNGTKIDTTTNTTYTDNSAPEGTDNYYVTAVNDAGESGQSNSINVLVDHAQPTITYTVSPTPNSAGWNNTPVTVTFSCSDAGSGIASCTAPVTVSTDGANRTVTGTATDNAGNTSTVAATVNLDTTVPMVGTPSWSTNPVVTGSSTTLTAPATATDSSPITGGEYYIGSTDPGQGNGTSMAYDSSTGDLTANVSAVNLTPGSYQINVRTINAAGTWSPIITTTLVVNPATVAPAITSANSYSIGVRQIITPSDFTIKAAGTPTPTLTESGTLPSGLSFTDNGDGTANFTGMVAASTAGTYTITIKAMNSAGSVSQAFTLTITNATSAPTTIFTNTGSYTMNATVGTAAAFTFTATGSGTNQKMFVYSGTLPPGMNLHDNKDGTGTISGTPTTAGTYTFTIEAENKLGVTYQTFTIVVS